MPGTAEVAARVSQTLHTDTVLHVLSDICMRAQSAHERPPPPRPLFVAQVEVYHTELLVRADDAVTDPARLAQYYELCADPNPSPSPHLARPITLSTSLKLRAVRQP